MKQLCDHCNTYDKVYKVGDKYLCRYCIRLFARENIFECRICGQETENQNGVCDDCDYGDYDD